MEGGRSITILECRAGKWTWPMRGGVLLLLLTISKLIGNFMLIEEIGEFAVLVHLNTYIQYSKLQLRHFELPNLKYSFTDHIDTASTTNTHKS